MPRRILLVDASPYIFRAFHSLPSSLRAPDGHQVNAVYGFAGFLLRLVQDEHPTHLALCFDDSLTTSFRNRLFPEYKAQREPPPVELEAQVDDCREIAEAMGLVTLTEPSFEADDLIGSLVARLAAAGDPLTVVSSDKDLAQLVADHVTFLDFARQTHLGPAEVVEKLGVRPRQVPDLLGLAGDSVDNIPGVRGIGVKTAVRLLEVFPTIEAMLDDLEAVAALPVRGARSVADRLEAERERALLSKQLATIAMDAPVPTKLSAIELRGMDEGRLADICDRLGFERLPTRVRAVM